MFKFKSSITNNTNNASIANVKLVDPLKYLNNFWRTLEMLIINWEVTLDLNQSENCVIFEPDKAITFEMTSVKLCIPLVTLRKQDINQKINRSPKSIFT